MYPHLPPTLDGAELTIHTYLRDPELVQADMTTLADQGFAAGRVLRGSRTTQSGSVLVFQNESIYADGEPQPTAPGTRFARVTTSDGTPKMYQVVKWTAEDFIPDEAITRDRRQVVDSTQLKLANSMALRGNRVAWNALVDEVTTDFAGSVTAWDSATTATQILRPISATDAQIRNQLEGHDPDILLITRTAASILTSDERIATLLRREDGRAPIYTNSIGFLLDLEVVVVPDGELPEARRLDAFVADSARLGGVADERPFFAKSLRNDETEGYLLQAGRTFVPYIEDTRAGIWIPGVAA